MNVSNQNELKISAFRNFRDKQPEKWEIKEVYNLIVSENLKENTEKYRYFRQQGLDKDAEQIKKQSRGVVVSAICEGGRTRKDLREYTGLCLGDFDDIPAGRMERCMALLDADPYVKIAHRTISGTGIRVFYLTDVTAIRQHKRAFEQGNAYFETLLGYPADRQCCDPARFSFLCYDPQAILHPQAKIMHIGLPGEKENKPAGRPRKTYHATLEKVQQKVLRALQREGKIYERGHRNEYISSALYTLNKYGVPLEEALAWAQERFADFGSSQVESIVQSVYRNTDEHGTLRLVRKQSQNATMDEIEEFVRSQAQVRKNVITERREIWFNEEKNYRDLTDKDENTLWVRAGKAGILCPPRTFQMVMNSEFVDDYNPLADYLRNLPPWDGTTDYIGRLAATVRTTTPGQFLPYFRKWFVGVVASLLEPLQVNHEILVLIGPQGYYKTTWFNRLLPSELNRYFYTKTNSSRMTKDDQFTLAEFALICFEEIDSMKQAELNQLKAMITMPTVNERAAYARNKSHRPHIASFCGTGNNIYFLNDPTGNRRWLPFEIVEIVNPYTYQIPYKELYAQALSLYRGGFEYWFSQEEIIQLNLHNRHFEMPDLEEELILKYYRKPKPGEQGRFASTADILQRINAMIKVPLSPVRIGMIMKKLGFDICRQKHIRGYKVKELTAEEISARQIATDQPEEQTHEDQTHKDQSAEKNLLF